MTCVDCAGCAGIVAVLATALRVGATAPHFMLLTWAGLVRFGVAPDHPEVKSVMNDFAAVAADAGDRLNFLGGVDVGSDIDIAELRKHYNAVILANGAQGDTSLGIQGEDLGNVFSARAFVNWYNGHPDFVDLNPNLDVEHVVVVGNGNVAIDCARVLAKSVEELSTTDIADHALEALAKRCGY